MNAKHRRTPCDERRRLDPFSARSEIFLKSTFQGGFHVPAAAFVSVFTGAKRRHGGRAAADFLELGLESLIKSEDCIRFENADRTPEWLREKNMKPQRTSTADCTKKSLRLSGMPLISAGPGLLLGAIGTAEHKR